jgi:hypothetical protein
VRCPFPSGHRIRDAVFCEVRSFSSLDVNADVVLNQIIGEYGRHHDSVCEMVEALVQADFTVHFTPMRFMSFLTHPHHIKKIKKRCSWEWE